MPGNKKRYDRFPRLAEMVRRLSPEGRELIRMWHQATKEGFARFAEAAPREAGTAFTRGRESRAAYAGAQIALRGWGKTMEDLAEVISDPREADWCCPLGMMAAPDPCPQHSAPQHGDLRDSTDGPTQVWLRATDVAPAGWYEIGRLRDSD